MFCGNINSVSDGGFRTGLVRQTKLLYHFILEPESQPVYSGSYVPQQLKSSNPNSSSWLIAPQPLTTTSDHCQVNYGQLACNANYVCLQYIVWLTVFVVYLNYCGYWHTVLGIFWDKASCENSHAGTTHIMETKTKLGRGEFLGVEDSSHSGHPIFTCMWHTNRKFKFFSSQYGHWTLRLGKAAIYWVFRYRGHDMYCSSNDSLQTLCCRIW